MITEQGLEEFLIAVFDECEQVGSEQTCADLLEDAFAVSSDIDDLKEMNIDDAIPQAQSFERAGILTNNRGVVVRFGDAEFQLTIVRSR
jgi:hypothetical protein